MTNYCASETDVVDLRYIALIQILSLREVKEPVLSACYEWTNLLSVLCTYYRRSGMSSLILYFHLLDYTVHFQFSTNSNNLLLIKL
jgi:hypothetical protein